MKKHMSGYKNLTVNGRSRNEIPGRLSDDEYAAMSASLKATRVFDGRGKAIRSGDYTTFRKRRQKYVAEENGRIIFLHKIIPGSASKSYGVHVARLAGVPSDLLENAERKLENLEKDEAIDSVRDAFGSSAESGRGDFDREQGQDGTAATAAQGQDEQISFFSQNMSPAVEKLKSLDIMETTPAEAIRILTELKEMADKE